MDNTTSFSNKIAIILDSVAYQSKPKKEAALIQYRFKETKPAILTVEEVARAVTSGQTVKPCVCFGPKDNQRYVCQSLFFLDFDNDSNVISSEEAVRYAKSHGLVPAFGYHSFSSTPKHEKFRLVFRSKYPILDPNLRDKIQATLMNIFKGHCDAKCKDRTRIFFGGKTAPFWLDSNAVFTPEEISAYAPAAAAPAPAKSAKQATKPAKSAVAKPAASAKSEPCAQITDLEEQFSEKPAQLTKLQENNLKSIKRALDRLLLSRKWVEGSKRHNFLYISFHTVWALEGAQAALQYVIKANKSFAMPVKEREIINALLWKNEAHEDGEFFEKWQAPEPLIYGKKRVISDLRLSKKEITSSKIYFVERRKKRAHTKAQKNQEKSALRDQFIAEQYFQGLRAKRIFAILPEDLKEGCSGPSSIEYTIKRLGLKNCKSIADVKFDECARYQKRSYPKQRASAGERQRIEAIIKAMCKEPGKKKKVKSKVNFSNTLTCESYKDFLKTVRGVYGEILLRIYLDKIYLDKPYLTKINLAKIDLTKINLTKIDLAKIDLAKIDSAKIDSAKINLAMIDLTKINLTKIDLAKIDLAKIDLAKIDSAKIDSAKINLAMIDLAKINLAMIDLAKIDLAKIDLAKIDSAKIDSAKINLAMIDLAKIDSAKIDSAKIDSAKIDLAKIDSAKIDSAKIDSAKINLAMIDLAKIDLAKIDSAKIDSAKIDLAKIDSAKIDSAKIDLAKIDSAKIDLAKEFFMGASQRGSPGCSENHSAPCDMIFAL